MHPIRSALLSVLASAMLVIGAHAGTPERPVAIPAGARCTASVMHPLSVHVIALDPVARGAVVRLLVRATSSVALDQAEARLISPGGAINRGPSSVALGALTPGHAKEAFFTVAVPPSGGRQYVEFRVAGRGPHGMLARGGCYNLLPDGPADAAHLVVTPQGERILEVRAGRIDE